MEIKQQFNYSIEIEEAVIGNILFSPALAPVVCGIISENVFVNELNREIFKKITHCVSEFIPYNYLTITDMLKTHFKAQILNGVPLAWYISKTMENVNFTPYIEQMCGILNEHYKARRLMTISDVAQSDLSPMEKQAKMTEILQSTISTERNTNWVQIGKAIDDYIKFYSENQGREIMGTPFGIPKLDYLTGGALAENLIIIAARPGVGKSALAQQICVNMAGQSAKSVGVVTLEMSNNELLGRMLSYSTGLNYEDLSRLKVSNEVVTANLLKMKDMQIMFSDATKCSIEGIRASVYQITKRQKIDVLIIDYLQLMESEAKTQNRNDEISRISRGLKEMAKHLKIPVIALAQLNREGAVGIPKLHNLRDGGSIEQDADKVIFIHGDVGQQERLLIVEKNRGGKIGQVNTNYIAERMAFIQTDEVYAGQEQKTDIF